MGRVSRNATSQEVRKIGEALDSIKVGFLGVAQIRDVHLYKSDLKPEGAIYTRIFTTPLHE
jgi:2'-5' RNA ligase